MEVDYTISVWRVEGELKVGSTSSCSLFFWRKAEGSTEHYYILRFLPNVVPLLPLLLLKSLK